MGYIEWDERRAWVSYGELCGWAVEMVALRWMCLAGKNERSRFESPGRGFWFRRAWACPKEEESLDYFRVLLHHLNSILRPIL